MRKPESESEIESTPQAARRRLPPAERREQILSATLPVFARKGYLGAGTRDLARAAGITEPILYRHFEGKAGLFRAVVARAGDQLTATLSAAVGGTKGARDRLRVLAEGLPGILEEHRDGLRVVNAAALAHEEPEILEAASACAQRIGQALAAAFRGSGLKRGVRAETAGFLLLEVGLGAAMLRPLAIKEMQADDYVERIIRALLGGIAG